MHEIVVDQKKWVSDSKFLHALNYCMLLPGPEAQQLATYIGWLLHGVRGGLVAGIFFVLPSVFILLGLGKVYVIYGSIPWVSALFYGLKPAVVAIVVVALFKIGKKSLHSWLHYAVALASFAAIYFAGIPFPYIILGAMVLGFVAQKLQPGFFERSKSASESSADEQEYYISSGSVSAETGFKGKQIIARTGIALALWAISYIGFYFMSGNFAFWKTLSLFFTKAALVTFGGAYAVLPYVAQVTVESWSG